VIAPSRYSLAIGPKSGQITVFHSRGALVVSTYAPQPAPPVPPVPPTAAAGELGTHFHPFYQNLFFLFLQATNHGISRSSWHREKSAEELLKWLTKQLASLSAIHTGSFSIVVLFFTSCYYLVLQSSLSNHLILVFRTSRARFRIWISTFVSRPEF
jgi:hypothetical protein